MIMQRKTIADLANAQCWSPLSGGRCSSPESPAFTPSNKVTYYSESMSSACDELRKWYFEGINREEAEDILRVNISNSGGGGRQSSDGLFLVRNGFCTQAGEEEFVLSTVQCNGRILHYQIRKCAADDAFYCIDEGRVVHGLDTLIEQMIVTDPNRSCRPKGARLVLRRACRGGQYPPAECRLHGRTNLLHRATKQANHSVVSELLKARNHNLEAKNEHGQTALHISAMVTSDSNCLVLRSLIEAGARVNTRDSQGMTALHYATIANNRTAVQLLLNEGNASPQVRNNSGWVALHFAAHFGFDEIIVQLLKYGCALNPRTATDETPFDLALRQKHAKCVRLLESFENRALINCPLKHEWFHEYLIDRKSSEQLLQNQGLKDGLFLIRYSKQKQHVLVLVHNERVYHFLIQRKRQFYSINDGPYFKTLNELVSYYHRFADGLPATLQIPALRSLNSAELACQQQQMRWISAEDVQIGLLIGYGKYGRVHHGVWRKKAFLTIEIAVKVLHDSDNHDCRRANEEDVLLREMQALRTLRNPHIVKIYGFCKGSPLMILEEMMPYGSLLDYVRSNAEELNVEYHLKLWLAQIALGMRYLERNRFVHGDLALRNVLLASETRAKISEFGTARLVGSNQLDISNACVQSPIVQWYAPECIKFARFTNASDVWSFGVTLWELYSFGEQPFAYEHCSGLRVLRFIESGERLERPEQCARKIYALMLMCWSYECDQRPTFEQICQLISEESFFENIRGEIET